ncbi:caib/baif family protein [Luminiphilus syltensis NOR5-1B]|uniref:Caib/baif family protein n=1 Tax=Luminiphilus syltensis NOR5-1B TaxID=565045 RepID=B8KQH7_9GAMM|nr:CoA transferase [Luminiphilus syltensis]EED36914.1 caib/baif family protein [Luminiphilus syltensis NOR5-1B]
MTTQAVTTQEQELELPLAGLRILEIADGRTDMCGRFLADLGATVIMAEPDGGSPSRRVGPMVCGESLYFLTHGANKESRVIDPATDHGRTQLLDLLSGFDLLINATNPGFLASCDLDISLLRQRFPALVILSISDFGHTGPYRDWVGDNAVHLALAGVLARSGIGDKPPLLPPGKLAYETAAIQAAWVALLALRQRAATGRGQHLDFSILEATAQILDPALGVTGSASGGRSAAEMAPRARPEKFPLYPTFPCRDGIVRVCVLNPRQWQAMSHWLGDDHPFTDEKYGGLKARYGVIHEVNALIAELLKPKTKADIIREGLERGIPIAVVASPSDVLSDEHFIARGVFAPVCNTEGEAFAVGPTGFLELNGRRMGIRRKAPELGEEFQSQNHSAQHKPAPSGTEEAIRPLAGIRVLDLGVIVAGAELGRLFADQGADVVKVENSQYPDGLRQSLTGEVMSVSFAQGSRNKRSLGLNLRCEKGRELFLALVEQSDVVLSNFKPGTMESLGLGYDVLKAANPGVVVFDSSALGNTGPQAKAMGYGPLVRSATGLTGLWRYPDEEQSFSDGVTIFPDHFSARISATAILALLLRRQDTGLGGVVSQSQAEAILTGMSEYFLHESLVPGSVIAGNTVCEYAAPAGVFQCAGDDEWCALGVHSDEQWQQFCGLLEHNHSLSQRTDLEGIEARWRCRDELHQLTAAWTRNQSPEAVMQRLQAIGVPAAKMLRVDELPADPHLQARSFFRELHQPQIPEPLLTENGPVGNSDLPEPDIRPAPEPFQHTREIARELLALSDSDIDRLVESGTLEVPA